MMRKLIPLVAVAVLAGCQSYTLKNNFNPKEVQWAKGFGFNEVVGEARVVVKNVPYLCDPVAVYLIPYSKFAEEKLELHIGRKVGASAIYKFTVDEEKTIENDSKDANQYNYRSTCTDGRFIFSGIPDGNWFLVTTVITQNSPTGGYYFINRLITKENRQVIISNVLTEPK
jgi:hypothetical protein